MVNPQIKEDALTAKNLQKLAEVYDILELPGANDTEIVKWAKDTGREIWTTISCSAPIPRISTANGLAEFEG